jgi:small subunit ribosomal protein S18
MSEDVTKSTEAIDENKKAAAPSTEGEKTERTERPVRTERPERSDNRGPRRTDDRRPGGDRPSFQKMPRFRKKICRFCHNKDMKLDYKKPDVLEKFLTERGKILPRRITGTCSKHQRHIAIEIKRARIIALLPFLEK